MWWDSKSSCPVNFKLKNLERWQIKGLFRRGEFTSYPGKQQWLVPLPVPTAAPFRCAGSRAFVLCSMAHWHYLKYYNWKETQLMNLVTPVCFCFEKSKWFFFMSWHQFTTRRQQIPKKLNVCLRSLMGNSWLMLTHRNELKVFCLRSYITLLYQVDTENDALSEMSTVKCGQKHIFDSLNVWSALPFLRAILCSLEVYQSLLMSQNFSDTTTEDNILKNE